MCKPTVDVAVGLLLRPDGSLLLAQRPEDKPWAGWWELPGGKIEAGETPLQALARELHEELDIVLTEATPWVSYTHTYPKTRVRLVFHRVRGWEGEPRGAEGQRIVWAKPSDGNIPGPLLPATEPPLRWLQLPDRYLISSIGGPEGLPRFMARLSHALAGGVRLVQFREPEWAQSGDSTASENGQAAVRAAADAGLYKAFKEVLALCQAHGAACLVNSVHPASWWAQADGVHFRAADAAALFDGTRPGMAQNGPAATVRGRPGAQRGNGYVAVSAHNEEELALARRLDADFIILGHVLDTASHPDTPGMGWERFSRLNAQAGLPVFALGGQSAATLDAACHHGAHGIAVMRGRITPA